VRETEGEREREREIEAEVQKISAFKIQIINIYEP